MNSETGLAGHMTGTSDPQKEIALHQGDQQE